MVDACCCLWSACRRSLTPHTSTDRLRDLVLSKAAEEEGMDEAWIRALPQGKNGRRAVHDDITVIVSWVGRAHVGTPLDAQLDGRGGGGKQGTFWA